MERHYLLILNWYGDAPRNKPQKEPHPQEVAVGLEGRLPGYWISDRRDKNTIDVENRDVPSMEQNLVCDGV